MGMALFGPGAVNTPTPSAKSATLTTAELEFAHAPTGPAIATIDEFNQALAAATAGSEPSLESAVEPSAEPAVEPAPAPAAEPTPAPAVQPSPAAAPSPAAEASPEVVLPKDATPLPTQLNDAPPAPAASSTRAAWLVAGLLVLVLAGLAVAFLRGA